jgi:hypothetical protein
MAETILVTDVTDTAGSYCKAAITEKRRRTIKAAVHLANDDNDTLESKASFDTPSYMLPFVYKILYFYLCLHNAIWRKILYAT